MTDITKQFNS